jgi:hypothetical protein
LSENNQKLSFCSAGLPNPAVYNTFLPGFGLDLAIQASNFLLSDSLLATGTFISHLMIDGRVAPNAFKGAYRDHQPSRNIMFVYNQLVSIWRKNAAYSTNGMLLK